MIVLIKPYIFSINISTEIAISHTATQKSKCSSLLHLFHYIHIDFKFCITSDALATPNKKMSIQINLKLKF